MSKINSRSKFVGKIVERVKEVPDRLLLFLLNIEPSYFFFSILLQSTVYFIRKVFLTASFEPLLLRRQATDVSFIIVEAEMELTKK